MAYDGSIKFDTKIDSGSLNKELSAMGSKVNASLKPVGDAISGTAKAIGVAFAGIAASIGVTGIKFNAEMEQYQRSFEAMLGSAEAALDMTDQLREMGAQTPFELSDLASATQTLLAFGSAQEDIIPQLKMLGDISLGNKEKLSGLAIVFGQVQSTGKLMGQDLLQMINNGFNPLQIISEKTGESMTDLKARMSDGKISFEEVADAMKIATSEGGKFYQAMELQSKTMTGQWSTIMDNFKNLSGKIMEPMTRYITNEALPAINKYIEGFDTEKARASVQKLTTAIGDFAKKAIPAAIDGIMFLIDNSEALVNILVSVAAGFAAFKVAATLIPIIQGISAAVKLAAAGQTLWNIAMAASPIGAIATVVGVLVGGLALLITSLDDTTSEFQQMKDETDDIIERSDDLTASLDDSAASFKDRTKTIRDDALVAERYIDRLDDMIQAEKNAAEAGEDTAAQREAIARTVSELNRIMPGLNAQYDAETGALNKSVEAMKAYVEESKNIAEAQARQERQTELMKERIAIEEELLEVQQQQTEITNERAKSENSLAEGTYGSAVRYGQLSEQIVGLNEKEAELQQQLTDTDAEFERHSEALVGLTEKTAEFASASQEGFDEAASAVQTFTSVGQENIGEFLTQMGFVDDAFKEQMDTLAEYEAAATGLWAKLSEDEKVSLEEMTANLEYNSQAVETWSQSLDELAKRGVDDGLIATLKAAGPEARLSISELVNASDEELAKLEDAFAKGGQAAVNALLRDVGEGDLARPLTESLDKAAAEVETNTSLEDATAQKGTAAKEALDASVEEADFTASGTKITENTATGITESTLVEESVTEKTTVVKEHSLTEVENNTFGEVGDKIQENEATAIDESAVVEEAVSDSISRAKTEADSAVSGADFESVGSNIAEGVARGISQGIGSVVAAIEDMIASALAAAETAADAHSPARAFIPLGINIDEGLGVGIERSTYSIDAARDAVTRLNVEIGNRIENSSAAYSHVPTASGGSGNTINVSMSDIKIANDMDIEVVTNKVAKKIGEKTSRSMRLNGGLVRA